TQLDTLSLHDALPISYCKDRVPRWNTISISGYHMREAGSTAAQEVAFTLSNAIAYVEAALAAGLTVDDFAPQLSFFFNAHNHLRSEEHTSELQSRSEL